MVPRMRNIETVALVLDGLAIYGALGLLFALAFLTFGIGRIDPAARGTGLGFRLVILPGVVALWPLLLARWIGSRAQAEGTR
jgi:hypothetical protein